MRKHGLHSAQENLSHFLFTNVGIMHVNRGLQLAKNEICLELDCDKKQNILYM